MPKTLKLLLTIGGGLVLLLALVGGGFRYWLKSNEGRFLAIRERAARDARTVAASTDAAGCVENALQRNASAQGFMAEAENKVFLRKCLELAQRPRGFCQGLPGSAELIKLATWTVQECAQRGYGGSQACSRLLQVVPEVCAEAGAAR